MAEHKNRGTHPVELFDRDGTRLGVATLAWVRTREVERDGVRIREDMCDGILIPEACWAASATRDLLSQSAGAIEDLAFAVHDEVQTQLAAELTLRVRGHDAKLSYVCVDLVDGETLSVTLAGEPVGED